MTLSALDPNVALIVVDLQVGTLSNPVLQPVDEVVANALLLVGAFRAAGKTVVIATAEGMPEGRNDVGSSSAAWPEAATRPIAELDQQPDDVRISRRSWSAFAGTDLANLLADRQITQIVVVGVATTFGVESTARAAYDLGLNVVVAEDAIKDMRTESHEHAVTRVFPILGQLSSSREIASALGL